MSAGRKKTRRAGSVGEADRGGAARKGGHRGEKARISTAGESPVLVAGVRQRRSKPLRKGPLITGLKSESTWRRMTWGTRTKKKEDRATISPTGMQETS